MHRRRTLLTCDELSPSSRNVLLSRPKTIGPSAGRRRNKPAKEREREGKSNEPSITRRIVQFRSCFALGVFGAHASFALQYGLGEGQYRPRDD